MKTQIEMIWEYNYWANRRILARSADLTLAQLSAKEPYMWDSILRTMAHVLGAEWVWRQRLQEGVSPTALLDQDQFTTLALLTERWAEEEAMMRACLAGLSDSDLEGHINYKNLSGQPFSRPRWHILTHIPNHGTQHRSEVALYLTNFGYSPGDMDISLFLAERG